MKPAPQPLTWQLKHSLWMGWLLTFGLLSWIAFLFLGLRLKQKKVFLWAALYMAPLPTFLFYPFDLTTVDGQTLNAIAGLSIAVAGVVALVHGIKLRKTYLARMAELIPAPEVVPATPIDPVQPEAQAS